MTIQGPSFNPVHDPEMPTTGSETGESDKFNVLLQAAVESFGDQPPEKFVESVLMKMEKQCIEINEYRISLILNTAFGSKEKVIAEIIRLTKAEFDRKYPEPIGNLLLYYACL